MDVDNSDGDEPQWKWTEAPDFAKYCAKVAQAFGIEYEHLDPVRWAIEDVVLSNPVEGSRELFPENHPAHDPALRYLVIEPSPGHWTLPSLVLIYRIEEAAPGSSTREVTGLELHVESHLGNGASGYPTSLG